MGIKRPTPDAGSYFEDDDDDVPAVVRKARRDDDERPRPASRRDVAPVDDDEDDDETPVRRRPAPRRPVADDDETPVRRRPAPRRPVADDDDEDDVPPPRAKRGIPAQRTRTEDDFAVEDENYHAPTSSRVAAGWGAAKAMQAEGGDFNSELKLPEDPTLIKFLADDPFAVYKQHFIREKEGKKSYVCLGAGCPLCDDLGHVPNKRFAFTVVDLTQETYAASQLTAGPKLLRILETNNAGKYGPLSRHYWEISRTGQGLKTDYAMSIVRDRYLKDDYGFDPEQIERVVAKIKPFTASDVKENSKSELRRIVVELDS